MLEEDLAWQSKLVLLAVLPFAAVDVFLACFGWAAFSGVAIWTIGLSALLGLTTWRLRAATPAAAATGALITASLMFSTIEQGDSGRAYDPLHTALVPVLAVSLLAFAATRTGRRKKERLGTAEARRGRSAAQVAANLGLAALVASEPVKIWLLDSQWLSQRARSEMLIPAMVLAALAEAAADTVSSEIGQVLGGRPRMITTLRAMEPGTDGAVSISGTLAGAIAAAIVAGAGCWALGGDLSLFQLSCAGAVFGLFFDSLLGATLERRGWLNNDAVNFLSTASAAGFAVMLLTILPHI
ncbi:MAG TPA: DUF92 domain-containing protein [Terracidiphilus sp.]|nr:DUF92 domain-containing protein [Terracidiphilus sp.]